MFVNKFLNIIKKLYNIIRREELINYGCWKGSIIVWMSIEFIVLRNQSINWDIMGKNSYCLKEKSLSGKSKAIFQNEFFKIVI